MKYIYSLFIVFLFLGCEEKLSINEYYERAKENYAKQEFDLALKDFESIVKYYPDSAGISDAVFMLGFINANDIKDLDEAKKYYELFIEKFPEHELAVSAKYELENLGKDVNELPFFEEIDSTKEVTSQQ